jgi:hypothetical protein
MEHTPSTRGDVGAALTAETYVLFWLAFREGEVHYGVCLNRYMVATAPSQNKLEDAIMEMVGAHMAASGELGIVPFAHLPQAPAEYWARWLEVTSRAPLKTLVTSRGAHWPPLQLAADPLAA